MSKVIFMVFPIGLFTLLGLVVIVYSIFIRLRGLPESSEQWRKALISWRILGPNTSPQALIDVKRCHDYLLSTSCLVSGICIVLAMVSWFLFALVTPDTSMADTYNGAFFLASVFFSLGIGLGIGAVFAAWRLRNTARQRVTYADLRQRRVSDYRNNAFRWLAIALIAWTFGVFVFLAPHGGPTFQIALFSTVVSVPNTVWGWSLVPVIMLLVFGLAEIVLMRIVGFSRLLVTSDTTVSQYADDMLRATVIGSVQYCELLALGQLAAFPFYILSPLLRASHYWQIGHLPYYNLISVSLFMPVVMQLLGVGIILGRGRLGGKLSGWPWHMNLVRQ